MTRYATGSRLPLSLCSIFMFSTMVHADQLFISAQVGQSFDDRPPAVVKESVTIKGNVGSLQALGASLTASGNPYAAAGSSATFSASLPNVAGIGAFAESEIGLDSFAFYPKRLGLLGSVELDFSGENTAASVHSPGVFGFTNIDDHLSMPLIPGQILLRIGGGLDRLDPARAYAGQGSLSYRFDLDPSVTRRTHWQGTNADDRTVDSAANWVEALAPDATTLAVFGKLPASQSPRLTQSANWAGLIVDGSGAGVSLDLEGHTLHLGAAQVLEDNFSALIGEERSTDNLLSFTNGTVQADSNILVQTRTAGDAGGRSSFFEVGAGASVNVDGIVSVSKFAGTHGVVSVTGADARLSAQGFILGAGGGGVAVVENGGRLELGELLQLARGPSSSLIAQMLVSDPGSHLGVSTFQRGSSRIDIGGRNRGLLTITNGASADFNSSEVTLGDANVASASQLTVTGRGTVLRGGTYNLGRGTTLAVLDGAELVTLRGAGIAVGTDALLEINNATVTAGNLFVSAGHAQARILNGGQFNASDEIRIDISGSLLIAEPGSRLQGFDSMFLNGDLLVGNGATVVGNSLAVGAGGRVIIGNGAMTVNEFDMAEGALIADTLAFGAPDDGGGGGGGGDTARSASFAFVESASPALFEAALANATPQGSLIEINGTVSIAAAARLVLHVYAPGDFDQLFVNGDFNFAGTLELLFSDDYAPSVDDSFDFIHVSGLFSGFDPAHILIGGLMPDWQFDTHLGDDGGLVLTSLSNGVSSVPLPSGMMPFALAVGGLCWRARRDACLMQAQWVPDKRRLFLWATLEPDFPSRMFSEPLRLESSD